MAFTNVDLTKNWKLITSEASFTMQNRAENTDVEVLFNGSLPAESDLGVMLDPRSGVTEADGTGSLYGRSDQPVTVVVLT